MSMGWPGKALYHAAMMAAMRAAALLGPPAVTGVANRVGLPAGPVHVKPTMLFAAV